MKKVEILISCAGLSFSVSQGETVTLPDDIADDLILHQQARIASDEPKTEVKKKSKDKTQQ